MIHGVVFLFCWSINAIFCAQPAELKIELLSALQATEIFASLETTRPRSISELTRHYHYCTKELLVALS